MNHEETVEAARKALKDVFNDTSVDAQQTYESLQTLALEIEDSRQALRDDGNVTDE